MIGNFIDNQGNTHSGQYMPLTIPPHFVDAIIIEEQPWVGAWYSAIQMSLVHTMRISTLV